MDARDTSFAFVDGGLVSIPLVVSVARLPTNPDAPHIAVLPNHVTTPKGTAVVESQVETVRQLGEGCRFETDTGTTRMQVFDGTVVGNISIIS